MTTTQQTVNTSARPVGDKPKAPKRYDIIAGKVILAGAGGCLIIVIAANLKPYSHAVGMLTRAAYGMSNPWLSYGFGFLGLAAVQLGEIFPYSMRRPDRTGYLAASAIATICYCIDAAMAIAYWFPLKVSLSRFLVAGSLSDVNWGNLIIMLVTLFGAELLIKLAQSVAIVNKSQN